MSKKKSKAIIKVETEEYLGIPLFHWVFIANSLVIVGLIVYYCETKG